MTLIEKSIYANTAFLVMNLIRVRIFKKTFSRNSVSDDFDDSVSCSESYRHVGLYQSLICN